MLQGSRVFHRVELTRERFPRVWQTLDEGLRQGVAPGFVAGLWRASDPDVVGVVACGGMRSFPTPEGAPPMQPETVFDLASITKIMATTALTMLLIDRRWIRWDDPVRAFLPNYPAAEVCLHHLLSHTAGLPAWGPFWEQLRKKAAPASLDQLPVAIRQTWMRELVLGIAPEVQPGSRTQIGRAHV